MALNKKKYKQFLSLISSKLFLLVGFLIVAMLIYNVGQGLVQREQVSDEIQALKDEIASLEKDESELTQLLSYFESDEYVRQEGKMKFGLKEEGERLVVINDTHEQEKPHLAITQEVQEELTNPQKWWRFFFN